MIDLPSEPGPRAVSPRVQDFGATLTPSTGGPVQRLNRLGNRYAVAVTMPPLTNARDGRIWVNRLVRGLQEGARMAYPLLDFDPGTPGSFVVDGADQAGTTLALRGGTPYYAFREGQPISLEVSSQHYLDFVAAQAIADSAGDVEIELSQMLRVSPGDGDALHVARPMIEGLLEGSELSWTLAVDRFVGLEFGIFEVA